MNGIVLSEEEEEKLTQLFFCNRLIRSGGVLEIPPGLNTSTFIEVVVVLLHWSNSLVSLWCLCLLFPHEQLGSVTAGTACFVSIRVILMPIWQEESGSSHSSFKQLVTTKCNLVKSEGS